MTDLQKAARRALWLLGDIIDAGDGCDAAKQESAERIVAALYEALLGENGDVTHCASFYRLALARLKESGDQ